MKPNLPTASLFAAYLLLLPRGYAATPQILTQPRRTAEGTASFLVKDPSLIAVAGTVGQYSLAGVAQIWCAPTQAAYVYYCTVPLASTPNLNTFKVCDVLNTNCSTAPEVSVGRFRQCGPGDAPPWFMASNRFTPDAPLAIPAAPSNLTLTPQPPTTCLVAQWQNNACGDEDYIKLELARSATGPWMEIARDGTHLPIESYPIRDEKLWNDNSGHAGCTLLPQTYYVRVSAVNAAGQTIPVTP